MRARYTLEGWGGERRLTRILPLVGALGLFALGGCTPILGMDFAAGRLADTPPTETASTEPESTPPGPDVASLAQGDTARAHGEFARAADFYREAHAANPKAEEPLLRMGACFVALQAYSEALNTYREAQSLAPKDSEVPWRLGELLLVTGQPAAALGQLTIAMADRRNDPRIYNAMGVAYGLLGKYDLAERNFAAGLRIAPDHIGLRDNLGLTQYLAGDYDAAVATLTDLAELPQAARARQNLAIIYTLHGDLDKARKIASRDLDPASVEANLEYYRALATKGQPTAQQGAAIFGVHFAGDPGSKENARVAARPTATAQSQ